MGRAMSDVTPSAVITEGCAYCGVGLRHELYRFRVIWPEGSWNLCPACVSLCLARIRHAHAEAGMLLERMWGLSCDEAV
jgi:hypothetical protein